MDKFTGLQYLQIDIASRYGLDKLSWQARLDWFNTNESSLDSLVDSAKEPAMFQAGVLAYRDYKLKEPSGFGISLDATTSCLQLISLLVGDEKGLEYSNVIDNGRRNDAYTLIYLEMQSRSPLAKDIKRSDLKNAIMTMLYGSTKQPEEVFGKGELLALFYEVMNDLFPKCMEYINYTVNAWQKDVINYGWILPDDFHVKIKVMNKQYMSITYLGRVSQLVENVNESNNYGRSYAANIIHSVDGFIVRELLRRCRYEVDVIKQVKQALIDVYVPKKTPKDYDTKMLQILLDQQKKSGYLSTRVLNHIHRSNSFMVNKSEIRAMIRALPKQPFDVLTIHDCFRCLPNYGNDLREQYNIILAQIYESDILESIISDLTNDGTKVNKAFINVGDKIFNANYALS